MLNLTVSFVLSFELRVLGDYDRSPNFNNFFSGLSFFCIVKRIVCFFLTLAKAFPLLKNLPFH